VVMTFAHIKCRGFTVIELLVVIAVIAVIEAMLLPVIAASRRAGYRTTCLSNERQIGLAIGMYADDSAERLPAHAVYGDNYACYWYLMVFPYLKNSVVLGCHADTMPPDQSMLQGSPPEAFLSATPRQVSYGYNIFLGGSANPDDHLPIRSVSEVRRPATTVMLTDVGATATAHAPTDWQQKLSGGAPRTYLADATYGGVTDPSMPTPSAPLPRHSGTADVLFVDGHAKALRVESFFTLPDQVAVGETQRGLSPCLRAETGCP
jgi:prepilin-type N-terminal cleavage/methylation domain-containing protein/prepilin-type processing-associated H-X9-DG protein